MFHGCCSNGAGRLSRLPRPARIAAHVSMGILIAVSFALLFGYVTMLLWNAVLPDIGSLPALTYWQAVGILLLARLLTGRFSHGGHGHPHALRRRRQDGTERYAEWWEAEGRAAFDAYLAKRQDDTASDQPHAG